MTFISTCLRGWCAPPLQWLRTAYQRVSAFASAHHTALIWCFGILYKFALDAMYVWAASPQYSYAGLVYAPSFVKYVLSAGMYFLLFTVLPKREKDTAVFLLHLQFVFTVAPMLSFYALSGGSSRYMLMVFLAVAVQVWIVCRPAPARGQVRITGIENYVTVALGVLILFTLVIPVLYNGFEGINAFDLDYIYVMRARAAYPPGFGYVLNWATNTILPFAFLIFLNRRHYGLAALCAALQVLFYMETGSKFTLLILAPILAVYLLSRTGHLLKLLYLGFVCICLAVVIGYQLDRTATDGALHPGVLLNAIVGIRAMFHPADNKFNFYEYFSQHPKIHFSDGIFGKVFSLTYPYAGSSGQVIYAASGGDFLAANMNTGYLGEAYAQLGFPGIFLMAALLGFILRALSGYDRKETFPVLTALFSVYIIILNDGALFTTLFTGGMLIAFLLVFIYLGKQEDLPHGI